jgi:hypothetical protein
LKITAQRANATCSTILKPAGDKQIALQQQAAAPERHLQETPAHLS